MAATMTWTISMMSDFVQYEGKAQVVYNLHWNCSGEEDSDGETYNGRAYGTQSLSLSDLSDFTPYDDVTEAQALGWLYAANDEGWQADIEAKVQEVIDNEITPKTQSGVPWGE